MASKPTTIKRAVEGLTPEQIQTFVEEVKADGGTCELVREDGKEFLICRYPPV